MDRKDSPRPRQARKSGRQHPATPAETVIPPAATAVAGLDLEARLEPRWPAPDLTRAPVEMCAINAGHSELGLAVVLVVRRLGSRWLAAHYVVDLLAHGVTECYGESFADTDSLEHYLTDLDQRVSLDTCTLDEAAAVVWSGARVGLGHGIAQPESLGFWGRLLPGPSEPATGAGAVRPVPRAMAVADVLAPLRQRHDDAWLPEDREPRLVVRAEPAGEQ